MEHPGLWTLKQITAAYPERHYLVYTAYHNNVGRSEINTFRHSGPGTELEQVWPWLHEALVWANNNQVRRANVYFSPGLRVEAQRGKHTLKEYAFFCVTLPIVLKAGLGRGNSHHYTREDRLRQFHYWHLLGLYPSIIIDSGTSLYCLWALSKPCSVSYGKPIVNHIYQMADGTPWAWGTVNPLLFPLPGFWCYRHERPGRPLKGEHKIKHAVSVLHPQDLPAQIRHYSPEVFKGFPPSDLEQLRRYYEAEHINAEAARQMLDRIGEDIKLKASRQEVQPALDAFESRRLTLEAAAPQNLDFKPSLDVVPLLNDVKFKTDAMCLWRRYVRQGLDMRHDFLAKLVWVLFARQWMIDAVTQRDIDFRLVYELCKRGYTLKAVSEFWNRTDHDTSNRADPKYLQALYEQALSHAMAAFGQPVVRTSKQVAPKPACASPTRPQAPPASPRTPPPTPRT